MTYRALCRSGDMRCRLAQRRGAVMAGGTIDVACSMGIRGRQPGCGVVTGVALQRGWQVRCRFCQGILGIESAAMAGRAIAGRGWSGGSGVTHRGRGKRHIADMAGIALRGGRDMVGRLAKRIGSVVARRAAPRRRR